jgi:hypothetical protein
MSSRHQPTPNFVDLIRLSFCPRHLTEKGTLINDDRILRSSINDVWVLIAFVTKKNQNAYRQFLEYLTSQ